MKSLAAAITLLAVFVLAAWICPPVAAEQEPSAISTPPAVDAPSTEGSAESAPAPPETEGAVVDAGEQDLTGETFFRANNAYEGGDYPQAVELYRTLLEEGFEDGHLLYNLGNAYLRNGEIGRAIASYRRSLTQRPRDEDVKANLSFARKSTKDAIAPPTKSPILSTLFFWHYGLSRAELATAAIVFNVLFFGVLVLRLFRRESEVLRWTQTVLLLLLLATAGSLAARFLAPSRIAVVLPQEIDAVSGTSVDAVVRFKLHAGTEVRVEDERPGWIRIALPDGASGWIQAEHAEVVRW